MPIRAATMGCGDDAASIASAWLQNCSVEVTTSDRASLEPAAELMRPDAPVYIASLPKDSSYKQLQIAIRLHELGLRPVPHIVARNLADRATFVAAIERFARLAYVNRALVLGGDRDHAAGPYHSALQLIRSGVFEDHGITRIAIACYPEGHPRIADTVLDAALMGKLEAAETAGINVRLITQLCFDANTIARFVLRLRDRGITADLRVGLAGPAKLMTLLKYAAICGVGPSLRALREQQSMARALLGPLAQGQIIGELADAMTGNPKLGITGLHFFTFASLRTTLAWTGEELERAAVVRGHAG